MASTSVTQPSNVAYDVNIGGIGFFLDNNSETPYRRQTAPYKKDQNDNSNDPGEQTLTGWWYRSQSSFHLGEGIRYFEPSQEQVYAQNQTIRYRYDTSYNVNTLKTGEVTLLNQVIQGHPTTSTSQTRLQSILSSTTNAVLSLDGQDVDKIYTSGNTVGTSYDHFIDYNGLTSEPVLDICNDGKYAYYVINQATPTKWHVFRKPLTGSASTGATLPSLTGDIQQVTTGAGIATNARIAWVKERIVVCADNSVYEVSSINPTTGAGTLSSAIYTHPSSTVKFTDIVESGNSVYISGYEGLKSFILRLTFDTTLNSGLGGLNGAVVIAQMPRGEIINCLGYYMGYLAIGTNKGARIAQVASNGDISYGPIIWQDNPTICPVYQFAFNESYVWAATTLIVYDKTTGTGATQNLSRRVIPGLIKIDLSQQVDTLRFAYQQDLSYGLFVNGLPANNYVSGVAFVGNTNKLCFTSIYSTGVGGVSGYHVIESSTRDIRGYILTGKIRFNTFENKIFYSTKVKGIFKTTTSSIDVYPVSENDTYGTLTIPTNTGYPLNWNKTIGSSEKQFVTPIADDERQLYIELTESVPAGYDTVKFNGYQIKALPKTSRQRLIQYPLMNYDIETDRYNQRAGYDGKAYAVLSTLETLENLGDLIVVTDNRTGETFTAQIEEVSFINTAPPDKRYDGYGGKLTVTVREI